MKHIILISLLLPLTALSQSNPYQYRPLDNPGINYPRELLRPVPDYWETQRRMNASNEEYYAIKRMEQEKERNEILQQMLEEQQKQNYLLEEYGRKKSRY